MNKSFFFAIGRHWAAHRGVGLLLVLLYFCGTVQLLAQPMETVQVRADQPSPFFSRHPHYDRAWYLWTVSGSGLIVDNPNPDLRIEADARFSLTDIQGITKPKLPVDDNPQAVLQAFCFLSPVSCRTYLATSARTTTKQLVAPATIPLDAEQTKEYRFIPDNDTYNPQHEYQSVVRGAGQQAWFMYIDRYGENPGNTYYNDNKTNNQSTTLKVQIERKSPELILTEGTSVINDEALPNVMMSRTLLFGVVSISAVQAGATLLHRQVVRNRGIDDLVISSIEVTGDINDFEVKGWDNNDIPTPITLRRFPQNPDSLLIGFRFIPKTAGTKELYVRLYCNDSTQNDGGTQPYFLFVVRGTATDARLDLVKEVDFGEVRVGTEVDTVLEITSIGSDPASFDYSRPKPPFKVTDADDPDSDPAPVSNLGQGNTTRVRVAFKPLTYGPFSDSLIVVGANTERYVIRLKGIGLLSAAVLLADTLDATDSIIDFGVTRVGQAVLAPFYVRNTGNIKLGIQTEVIPHYSVVTTPNTVDPNSILEFKPAFTFGPTIIDTSGTGLTTLMMRYNSDPDISVYPTGDIEALLNIGVSEAYTDNDGNPAYRMIAERSFILKVRKVEARPEAAGHIGFDSVYINNACPDAVRPWPITNVSAKNVSLDSQKTIIIRTANGNPFTLTGRAYPVQLDPQETDERTLAYRPITRGADSVRFRLYYSAPGADSIEVLATGVGVEQEIRVDSAMQNLTSSRYTISNDTIDMGNIRVGALQTATIYLSNQGNLPFQLHPSGQIVSPVLFPGTQMFFSLIYPFTIRTLGMSDTAMIIINVRPLERGQHVIRYTLPSDIIMPERGIKCVPVSAAAKIFHIRFNAVQPALQTDHDELDFGNVIYIPNCPRSYEQSFRITNTGSTTLEVEQPTLFSGKAFVVLSPTTGKTLQTGESTTVLVRFTPTGLGQFTDTLYLKNNGGSPGDTTMRVILIGNAMSPQPITVSLPVLIQSRPGTRIAVPVTVNDAEFLASVNTFKTTLLYDKSLLVYAGRYTTEKTASEKAGAGTIDIDETPRGELHITISHPAGMTFLRRDTLIILYFDTYLGEAAFTPVTFQNADFSDGACTGLLTVSTERGVFELDSVCNLQALIGPPATGAFRLEQNTPNPAGADAYIEYEIAFATDVALTVFNGRGERVAVLTSDWHFPGTYRLRIPTEQLPPGLYFYEMKAGIFRDTRKMYIAK